MPVEITKKGAKVFRFEEPLIQVGGGCEDTMMTPCRSRGCKNSFEQPYPEPEDYVTLFCPDCREQVDYGLDY
jgi:hypothetical protein